jgi:single-strand DNA-binding protein
MNSVNLIGRLTTAPELHDRAGTQVGRLRLAIPRPRGKDGEDRGADYVDITTFGRQAEVCNSYLAKGRRVAVEGHLRHSEWEADDGTRRQKLEVVAERVEFLEPAPRDTASQPAEPGQATALEPASGEPQPVQAQAA